MKVFVALFCCVLLGQTRAQSFSLTSTEVTTVRTQLAITADIGADLETFTNDCFRNNRNSALNSAFLQQLYYFLEDLEATADNLARFYPTFVPIVSYLKDISTQFQIIFSLYRAKGISTTTIVAYYFTETYYNVIYVYSVMANYIDRTIPVIEPKSISVPKLYTSEFTTAELATINNALSSINTNVQHIVYFFQPAAMSTYLTKFVPVVIKISTKLMVSFKLAFSRISNQDAAFAGTAIFNAVEQARIITEIYWLRATNIYLTFKQAIEIIYNVVYNANFKFILHPPRPNPVTPGPNPVTPCPHPVHPHPAHPHPAHPHPAHPHPAHPHPAHPHPVHPHPAHPHPVHPYPVYPYPVYPPPPPPAQKDSRDKRKSKSKSKSKSKGRGRKGSRGRHGRR